MYHLRLVGTVAALSLASLPSLLPATPKDHGDRVEISITNLTRGQIMSPFLVATHDRRLKPVFTLGSPASKELAMLAEDAVHMPLMAQLKKNGRVKDVVLVTGKAGPIMPGETVRVRVRADDELSLLSMLVTTNDAFASLNGVSIRDCDSKKGGTYYAVAYDAGSEENNENGAFIPGPPFGNGMKRATKGAEGFVHVHAGVHGIKDLVPAKHDWRNPVAKVSVRRVRD